MKLATTMASFQVEVGATPTNRGVANINYERKPLQYQVPVSLVPTTRTHGTNYPKFTFPIHSNKAGLGVSLAVQPALGGIGGSKGLTRC